MGQRFWVAIMANSLEESVSFETLWATLPFATERNRIAVFKQFMALVKPMPLGSVIDTLDGAPDEVKAHVWGVWGTTADLSGARVYTILQLKSEPPSAVAAIVKKWLEQVDLTRYSLDEVVDLTEYSIGMLSADDIQKFWLRWVESTDLRRFTLVDFAKSIRSLAPETQLTVMNGYVQHCPDILRYGAKEKEAAKKHLLEWTIAQCPLFTAQQAPAKFKIGQEVFVKSLNNLPRVIQSVLFKNGVYWYWLKGEPKYHPEADLEGW